MNVILISKNSNSGKQGTIVSVNKGYARNFLIRKGFAIIAKKKNIDYLKQMRKHYLKQYKLYIYKIKTKLKNVKIEIFCKSGQTGKIVGSIGRRYLSKVFYEKYEIKINKKHITIKKNIIKKFGEYKISLYEQINIKINIQKYK